MSSRMILFSLLCLAVSAPAPTRAANNNLIEAAKKDGVVTWYTTQIVDQLARPAAEAFEKEYGIKVQFTRANSADIALRLTNEAQAGHVMADVVDSTSITLTMKKQNLLLKWLPDAAAQLPKQFSDPEGFWTAASVSILTPGYNTNLVAKGEEPKRFRDLLDQRWKGKLVWGSTPSPSAAPGFIGTVLKAMGEDDGMQYLRSLSKQNVTGLEQSARQVLDQVIAGEYAIALQIFNYHASISEAQGAPCTWVPLEGSMAETLVFSVMRQAPHPNAGKLFEDFMTSREGQEIFRDADYLPVDPDLLPRDPALRLDESKFHVLYFTPEELEQSMPKWMSIYRQLFL